MKYTVNQYLILSFLLVVINESIAQKSERQKRCKTYQKINFLYKIV